MPYTAPTLSQAQTALAARLYDPGLVHWSADELTVYIREALRVWNAWTATWRDRASFVTTLAEPFYDLPTEIPTLRASTVTNWELMTQLEYMLLEPPTPSVWTGSDQFTLQQLSDAIQRRRDQFMRDTGTVVQRTVVAYASPPADGRITLDESVLIIRRAAWTVDATAVIRPLTRTDEWAGTHYQPGWPTSTQSPSAYAISATPPLTMQLIPPATTDGTLDLVAVTKGDPLDPLVETSLGVPDDWAHVILFGALADLLGGDALALDPERAKYCAERYAQGVELANEANVVLAARINDVTCLVGSLSDADSYSPLWQLVPGTPRRVLLSGQNLLAVWPPPGVTGGQWTITLDVVQNAPVPTLVTDILQVSADVYDSILDYAQHLAIFKEGPQQLQTATALLERAARATGVTMRIQQASQPDRGPLLGQTHQDERSLARELDPVSVS